MQLPMPVQNRHFLSGSGPGRSVIARGPVDSMFIPVLRVKTLSYRNGSTSPIHKLEYFWR